MRQKKVYTILHTVLCNENKFDITLIAKKMGFEHFTS